MIVVFLIIFIFIIELILVRMVVLKGSMFLWPPLALQNIFLQKTLIPFVIAEVICASACLFIDLHMYSRF